MFIPTRYMAAWFAVAAPFATVVFTQTNSTNPGTIVGTWRGTATTGRQSAEVAFDIRGSSERLALYVTLPRLHAWRMPVDFLKASPDGSWSVPDWHIVLRRSGDTLTGELGDPRVKFELSRSDALPEEPRLPVYPPGPSPAWTYDAGAPLWGSAVASEGVAYIGDTRGTLHAVNASRGTRVWTIDVGAPIYGAPLAAERSLFVFDDAGVLHRIDRRTGTTIWRVDLGADSSPRALPAATVFTFDFHSPAPVVHDGTLYVASSRGVTHAIAVDSGNVTWRRELKSKVRAAVAVSDERVFVATLDNDLIALDRRTGEERWRFKASGPVTSAPAVANNLVLLASRGSWITALNADTGAEVWAHYDWFSWIESSGVLADGTYYVGSSDLRAVRAIDPRTGEVVWETDVLGWAWGTPALTGDTIYIGVAGPQKYVTRHEAGLVALDRKTGMVRWRRPVPADPAAFVSGYPGSVALSDAMLIAPNVNGTLEGYRLR